MVLDIADPSAVNYVIVAFSIDGFKILLRPGLPVVASSQFYVVTHPTAKL